MSVRVRVAALLHSYTDGKSHVEAEGTTVGEVVDDLDRRHPGIGFRIVDEQGNVRRHIHLFVGEESARTRATPVPPGVEVFIVGALSGG
jgi:molybdopterin converting factor small subunit